MKCIASAEESKSKSKNNRRSFDYVWRKSAPNYAQDDRSIEIRSFKARREKPAWRGLVAIVNNFRYVLAVDERVYCTYIVASRSHTLYIGVTGDLLKRIFEHKQVTHPGFSATYNCSRLVWFERFVGPSGAIAREKQLKGWIRAKKIALIEKGNPTWSDLSEGWYAVDPTIRKGS